MYSGSSATFVHRRPAITGGAFRGAPKGEMRKIEGDKPYHVQLMVMELNRREARNAQYSLRAYGRSLGLHPSAISRILAGKQEISLAACAGVVAALKLSTRNQRRFIASVVRERRRREMQQLGEMIGNPELSRFSASVNQEIFERIADFHCAAVMEACSLEGSTADPAWFAGKLGLGIDHVKGSLSRLVEMGLIRLVGDHFEKTHSRLSAGDEKEAAFALRSHQRQGMEKALQALDFEPVERCVMVTMVMASDSARIRATHEMIKEFTEDVSDALETAPGSELFQLSVQFFPISKREKV